MIWKSFCFLGVMVCLNANASKHAPISVNKKVAAVVADSMQFVFGSNKNVPEKFRLPFYYALQFYPELQSLHISVKEKKISTTMAARPSSGSVVFRFRKKRHYIVFVNSDTKGKAPHYDEFSFNAQIGVFGHELAHFLKYIKQGVFSLMGDALKYRKDSFKSHYECYTDSITIARGLGWQCYDFSTQLQNNQRIDSSYKSRKEELYYTPRKIFALMSDLGYDM
ncbi:MAG TPA: hypothetical protein PK637_15600 [Flavobacteriales bacterium]|nr:hypothetical protein [Flavobacteriales bacterium]HRE98187.1 hypothetical protein [Flavobacteriales bacterium]HRJ35476.1 hypothetical protein [Flavobacteriales bacterium]HRJ37764.1 hypothetical protein [Flavobacteriales bacterium]